MLLRHFPLCIFSLLGPPADLIPLRVPNLAATGADGRCNVRVIPIPEKQWCCVPLFGREGYKPCFRGWNTTHAACCSGVLYAMSWWQDMNERLTRLSAHEELPRILNYYLPPDYLYDVGRELLQYEDDVPFSHLGRLSLYSIWLEGEYIAGRSRPLHWNELRQALLTLNWEEAVSMPQWNTFMALARLQRVVLLKHGSNKSTPLEPKCLTLASDVREVLVSIEGLDGVRRAGELYSVWLQYCSGQSDTVLYNFPYEGVFSALDRATLPRVVRQLCKCKGPAVELCKCFVEKAFKEGNVEGYDEPWDADFLMALPQTRETAAQIARNVGPFVLKACWQAIWELYLTPAVHRAAVFVEVGAHFGDAALAAAALFERANRSLRVIAYEPQREAFEFMQASIELNGFANITAHRKALVSHEQYHRSPSVEFGMYEESSVHGTLLGSSPFSNDRPIGEEVPASTLDLELGDQDFPIDLLVVHTNGAELHVLKGATQLLRSGRISTVKFRFYGKAQFVESTRVFRDVDKLNELDRLLRDAGCQDVWHEKDITNADEFGVIARHCST
ncbi:hypothetical protein FOZ61_009030 [Perkinsus olseni]|uniref:Methyltransferase FkbM domain-containing protein n=1 Tax=Perkinsus olseni TaxID=32597 RepID=A0A7J6MG38_PEROL|nr:hypothetical protein FOZ61_009030 [Perkinsus olseni]KAF4670376.1 hypothetical protein FOL46_000893 [Perkinsus olseni]